MTDSLINIDHSKSMNNDSNNNIDTSNTASSTLASNEQGKSKQANLNNRHAISHKPTEE